MKIKAFVNHGRWLVECPDDKKHYAEVKPGQESFICAGCYPDLSATLFKQRPDGLFESVPDEVKRSAARKTGKHYEITFPDKPAAIMELLRQRPVEYMNWIPGETLDYLKHENSEHRVGPTPPDVSIVKGGK